MKLYLTVSSLLVSISISYCQVGLNLKASKTPLISEVEFLLGPSKILQDGYGHYNKINESKVGYLLSSRFVHPIATHWNIAAIALLERKGSKTSENYLTSPYASYNHPTNLQPPVPTTATTILDDYYLSFCIMPRFLLGERTHVQIGIGPYFSLLRKSVHNYTVVQNGQVEFREEFSPDNGLKKNDAGISFCLGYSFPVNARILFNVQLLENYGLMNITTLYPSAIRNNSLSLLFGLTFKRYSQRRESRPRLGNILN